VKRGELGGKSAPGWDSGAQPGSGGGENGVWTRDERGEKQRIEKVEREILWSYRSEFRGFGMKNLELGFKRDTASGYIILSRLHDDRMG
jgi:hypothetical protein